MKNSVRPYLFNWLVSSFIFIVLAIIIGFVPFGDTSMLTIDLGQQYIDFYSMFRETVFNQPSMLLYSFEKAIGGEMIGLWAYYLLSPFNVIFLLFPENELTLAVTFITYLKITAASLTFFYLTRYKYQLKTVPAILFSQSYAFMSYAMVYLLNIMWLDGLILLPLIAAGLDKAMRHSKNKQYIFSLALILIANYYIGYMICLFLAFYALYVSIEKQTRFSIKETVIDYLLFIKNSLIAALLAAVTLVPTFVSLTQNKGSHLDFEVTLESQHTLQDIGSKFFMGSFVFDEISSGSPNLYAGMLVLLLVVLYFLNLEIKWSEKVVATLILIIFYASFHLEVLDQLWHGGQFPIWYDFRFSFLASFFLMVLAINAFKKQKSVIPTWQLLTALTAIAVLVFYYYFLNDYVFLTSINLFMSLVIFLLLLIILQLDRLNIEMRHVILLAIVTIEMIANASMILTEFNYVAESKFQDYVTTLDDALVDLRHGDDDFYRINKTYQRTKDEAMFTHYHGLDHFGSTIEANVPELYGYLGLPDGNGFATYTNGTLFTDDFFNVRYLLDVSEDSADHTLEDEYVLYPRATDLDIAAFPIVNREPRFVVHENQERLGLAMEVSPKIVADESSFVKHQPIHNQELLLNLIDFTGDGSPYFKEQDFTQVEHQNLDVSGTGDGDYFTYEASVPPSTAGKENDTTAIKLSFETTSEHPYYFSLPSQYDDENVSLRLNGKRYRFYTPYRNRQLTNASYQTIDEAQELEVALLNDTLSANLIKLYEFDETRFNQMIREKQSNLFEVSSFRQNYIEGNITTEQEEGYLLLTIPYDAHWQITLDGQSVEPVPVLNETLMAIPVSAGQHEVSLHYFPSSIWYGSIASFVGALALVVDHSIKKRKKTNA